MDQVTAYVIGTVVSALLTIGGWMLASRGNKLGNDKTKLEVTALYQELLNKAATTEGQLRELISTQRKRIDDQDNKIEEQDKKIEDQESKIEKLNKIISSKDVEIEALHQESDKFRKTIEAQAIEITNLQDQVAVLQLKRK